MKRRGRITAMTAGLVLAAVLPASAGLLDGGIPGLVPTPAQDSFYDLPAGLAGLPNGKVLATRTVTVTALTVPATSRQVKYKTTDANGRPTAAITTLLEPLLPWAGTGPRPLVSYQHGSTGLATKCQPSYSLRFGIGSQTNTNFFESSTFPSLALLRGFAVSVPDYDSLRNTASDTRGATYATLDGLRAVRGLLPPATPMGLLGFAAGGSASISAAAAVRTYAPELPLKAVAASAIIADFTDSITAVSGSVLGAGSTVILGGLQRAYPQWHIEDALSPYGKQILASVQDDCLIDSVLRYPLLQRSQLEASPGSLTSGRVAGLIRSSGLAGTPGTPSVPSYITHGALDEIAPVGPVRDLVRRYCAAGAMVQYVENPLTEHFSEGIAELGAIDFLEGQFLGRPAVSTC